MYVYMYMYAPLKNAPLSQSYTHTEGTDPSPLCRHLSLMGWRHGTTDCYAIDATLVQECNGTTACAYTTRQAHFATVSCVTDANTEKNPAGVRALF